MIKRLPSMIVPALLLIAVLSTSVVKPAEYVRISPSATARPLVRGTRPGPAARSGGGQPMPAEFDLECWCAVGLRGPVPSEMPDKPCQGLDLLLAVPAGNDMFCDPR